MSNADLYSAKNRCICCLTENTYFLILNNCEHFAIFNFKEIKFTQHENLVCVRCHSMLKKFHCFKRMVIESLNFLSGNKEKQSSELIYYKTHNLQIKKLEHVNISSLNIQTEEYNNFDHNKAPDIAEDPLKLKEGVNKKVDNIQMALNIINRNKTFFNVKPQIFEQIKNVVLSSAITAYTPDLNKNSNEETGSLWNGSLSHGESNEGLLEKSKQSCVDSQDDIIKNRDGVISANHNLYSLDNLCEIAVNINKEEVDATQEKINGEISNVRTIKLTVEELNGERLRQQESQQYQKWKYKCDGCIISFSYEENLRDHIKRKHTPGVGTVTCGICSQVYQEDNHETHLSRHFNRYECLKCNKRFALLDEANRHFRLQHTKRKHQCNICSFKTNSLKMFTRHRARQCGITKKHKTKRKQH